MNDHDNNQFADIHKFFNDAKDQLSRGEKEKALVSFEKSIELQTKYQGQRELARLLTVIGYIYEEHNQLDQSFVFLNRSLDVYAKINDMDGVGHALNNIGGIYRYRGDFNLALEYYQKSLEVRKKLEDQRNIANSLQNIGRIYFHENEYEKATEYLQKGLELRQELLFKDLDKPMEGKYHHRDLVTASFDLILVHVELNDTENAETYFSQMQQVIEVVPDPSVKVRAKLGRAIILKSSDRLQSKMEALSILKKIIDEELPKPSLSILAMQHYCELLLIEIKALDSKSAISEALEIADQLLALTTRENMNFIRVETLIFKAKLALIRGEAKQAEDWLNQGKIIAKKNKYIKLLAIISIETARVQEKVDEWQTLLDKNISVYEKMKLTRIEKYIKDIRNLEVLDDDNE